MTESPNYIPSGSGGGKSFDDARETIQQQAQAGRIAPPVILTASSSSPVVREPRNRPSNQNPIPAKTEDVLPGEVVASSTKVLRLVFDLTISMLAYIEEVWRHMGSLDFGITPYLGDNRDIGLFGFADGICSDPFPLQAKQFVRGGVELAEAVLSLKVHQFGGKTIQENIELMALYLSRRVITPNATTDVTVLVTDELPYDQIEPRNARLFTGIRLSWAMSTDEVFKELKGKTKVYVILRPYTYGDGTVAQQLADYIYNKWVKLVGQEYIAILEDPRRIVDVICGILAKETDKVAYYEDEIIKRQTGQQVAVVSKALQSIHGQKFLSRQSKMNVSQNP